MVTSGSLHGPFRICPFPISPCPINPGPINPCRILIMPSAQQRSDKYQYLSHWLDSTRVRTCEAHWPGMPEMRVRVPLQAQYFPFSSHTRHLQISKPCTPIIYARQVQHHAMYTVCTTSWSRNKRHNSQSGCRTHISAMIESALRISNYTHSLVKSLYLWGEVKAEHTTLFILCQTLPSVTICCRESEVAVPLHSTHGEQRTWLPW